MSDPKDKELVEKEKVKGAIERLAFQRPTSPDENYAKLEYPDIWETIDALEPAAESGQSEEETKSLLKTLGDLQVQINDIHCQADQILDTGQPDAELGAKPWRDTARNLETILKRLDDILLTPEERGA